MTVKLSRRSCVRLALIGLPLSLSLLMLTGCSAILANAIRTEQTEQHSFDVQPQPAVIVDTFNGDIAVTAVAGTKVDATVTKIGSGASQQAAEADLNNVKLDFTQEGNSVHITAKRTGSKLFGSSGARVDLKVPPGSSLSLTTQNGAVTTKGVERDITARSSNGKIEVAGARGKLDLETSNGPVGIAATGASVSAHSSNGDVSFAGSLAKGNHSLETSNGSLILELPASTPLQFSAQTSNGTIKSRFSGLQTKSGKPGSNHWSASAGTVSDANVAVHLETSNGSISIEPLPPAEASVPR
jgi:DUF4097 and DUF4098 domain-containing protein YvlB